MVTLVILACISSVLFASHAKADSVLCSGSSFSTCINNGYSAYGYENNSYTSYWKAVASTGHNCTNYVGYRLALNGDTGPGVAMGDASHWDNTIAANPQWGYTIDHAPTKGSIALWESGSYGHVAYVEEVIDSNTIKISEDTFPSGPFQWRIITKTGNWPNKFLHITNPPPASEGTTATVMLNGQVQSFYYDATKGNLRHAWTDANGWHFEQLDGDTGSVSGYAGDVGKYVSARAVGNQLQVFYYDTTKGNLRHAWTDANGWHFESLDGDAGSVSHHTADVGQDILVLQGSPNLQLFYYDATVGDLRHAWSDASGWHFEQLDGSGGSVSGRSADSGRHTSGLYQSGDIQLFYYEMTTGNLRHAWSDSSGWHFENLDGDTGSVSQTAGDVGKYTSVVFVGSYMQLFYYDSNNKNLRHAWNDSNGWHFENLDGDSGSVAGHNADVGGYAKVGNSNGYLQLFYYDKTNSNLRHAWTNSSGWHFENLDGDAGSNAHFTANTGMYANLTVMGQYVRLFYYDATNTNVRHAWTDENGWRFETFDGSTSSVAGYAADVW